MVVDTLGNVCLTDSGHYVVRKVTPGGTISTVAGNWTQGANGDGGLAASAQLNAPWGLAFDSSGNLYISDSGALTIRKVNASTGVISTFASGSYIAQGVPKGLAFDSSGNLWVAVSGTGCASGSTYSGSPIGVEGNHEP